MSPNRIVAVLTPLLFAPLAGSVSALAAEYFPGIDVPSNALEEIFIAGALIAFAKAAQWTQGWQKYEAREADRSAAAEQLDSRESAISARESEFGGGYDLTPVEDYGTAEDYDTAGDELADDVGYAAEEEGDYADEYDDLLADDPELDLDDEYLDEPALRPTER
jgi:hypothetical protein